jgi:hypothetical protein
VPVLVRLFEQLAAIIELEGQPVFTSLYPFSIFQASPFSLSHFSKC